MKETSGQTNKAATNDQEMIKALWKELSVEFGMVTYYNGKNIEKERIIRLYTRGEEEVEYKYISRREGDDTFNAKLADLEAYLKGDLLRHVAFIVNEDGVYTGPENDGYINWNEDKNTFVYTGFDTYLDKGNYYQVNTTLPLDCEEEEFLSGFVERIRSVEGENSIRYLYKKDLIVTDRMEKIMERFKDKILWYVKNYWFQQAENGQERNATFYSRMNITGKSREEMRAIKIVDNKLHFVLMKQYNIPRINKHIIILA